MSFVHASMWALPPPVWSLAPGEVHIWLASLDQPAEVVAACEAVLSNSEREKAGRMHFAVDRQRAILARGILRQMLGQYLRIPPAKVAFVYNEFGKPSLAGNQRPFFNLSHSGARALYAVTDLCHVGIDLEELRPLRDAKELARTAFTVEEQTVLHGQNELAFFKIWTRKEARAKCDGRGIAQEIAPTAAPHVYEINPGFGFAAALALEVAPRCLRTWLWPVPMEDTEFSV